MNEKQNGPNPWANRKKLDGVKHIVAVASGKGGVGKSTVAVNIAAALAAQGQKVGILDLDVYGPSLPTLMGVQEQPQFIENKIQPILKYDLKLLSFGMLNPGNSAVIWRGPLVAKLVNQFFDDTDWGELDCLVIDLPPGTGDVQLSMVQRIVVDGVIMVTTPQDLALLDVQRGGNMFRKVNTPLLGIVENMSYFSCPHCGKQTQIFKGRGGEIESQRLDIPLLGKIALDPNLTQTSDEGVPEVVAHKDSEVSKEFLKIAEAIDERFTSIGR